MTKSKQKISVGKIFNSHLTSIISISLVLFLVGMVSFLLLLANDLSVYVKENISFSIVLKQDVKDIEIKRLQKRLDAAPYVKSTDYITKERALEELSEELGQDPLEFLGFNPLLPSLDVKLHSQYANNDSIAKIEAEMNKYSEIKEVNYQKNLITAVNENVKRISSILFGFVSILLVISFALINNTIRLSVYSKRFLIHTMKLVGANRGFIRRPFLLKSILHGLAGATVTIVLLSLFIYGLSNEINGVIGFSDPLMIAVLLVP